MPLEQVCTHMPPDLCGTSVAALMDPALKLPLMPMTHIPACVARLRSSQNHRYWRVHVTVHLLGSEPVHMLLRPTRYWTWLPPKWHPPVPILQRWLLPQ